MMNKRIVNRQFSYQQPNLKQKLFQKDKKQQFYRRSSQIQLPKLIKQYNRESLRYPNHQQYQFLKNNRQKKDSGFLFQSDNYEGDVCNQFIHYKSKKQRISQIFIMDYNVFDLTQSLIHSGIKKLLLSFIYAIMIIIRYATIASLIYLTFITRSKLWEWVLSLIFCQLLYAIALIKISLRNPKNSTEQLIKICFNSLQQNQFSQFFKVIDYSKLFQTILKSLVPAQLSFLIIVKVVKQRRFKIYCAVNYIYSSIYMVLYYPFFIIYSILMYNNLTMDIQKYIYRIILTSAIVSELIFIIVTMYIACKRCKTKYSYLSLDVQASQ